MAHVHRAYGVPGLDAEGARLLSNHLRRIPGVHDVTVWIGQQQIDVDYDPAQVTPEALAEAARELGYLAEAMPYVERWPG